MLQVVGQIDRKFIACIIKNKKSVTGETEITSADQECSFLLFPTIPDLKSDFLVLFDQHAAHERVRLEQFTRGR